VFPVVLLKNLTYSLEYSGFFSLLLIIEKRRDHHIFANEEKCVKNCDSVISGKVDIWQLWHYVSIEYIYTKNIPKAVIIGFLLLLPLYSPMFYPVLYLWSCDFTFELHFMYNDATSIRYDSAFPMSLVLLNQRNDACCLKQKYFVYT
jgi:hypothetical protein